MRWCLLRKPRSIFIGCYDIEIDGKEEGGYAFFQMI
jgi:hypothetical protein